MKTPFACVLRVMLFDLRPDTLSEQRTERADAPYVDIFRLRDIDVDDIDIAKLDIPDSTFLKSL